MTSSEYIKAECEQVIVPYRKKAKCKHEWIKHGYGYLCRKCEYYTGLCSILNGLIKKELNGRS